MAAPIIDVSSFIGDTLVEAVRDASDGVLRTTRLGDVFAAWMKKTEAWGSPCVVVYSTHDTASFVLALLPAKHYPTAVMPQLAALAASQGGGRCRKAAVLYKGGERARFTNLAQLDCPVFVAHMSDDRDAVQAGRVAGLVRDYLLDSRT